MKDFKKLLSQFVSIPSVSADISYKKSVERTAQWVASYARNSGLQTKIIKGFDNPIIIAKTKKNSSLKTILIYGHYDVQPAKTSDGWKSDPFSLTEKNGRLYGRGSADNKGQILIHLYSIADLIKQKRLGFHVIFLIEGNEETGSPLLNKLIKKEAGNLNCHCVIISDGELDRGNSPTFEGSFRGTVNLDISIRTAEDDLHSGIFGGAVPNSAEELSRLISKFHNVEKKILVANFYDGLNLKTPKKLTKTNLKILTGTKKVFARSNEEYARKTGLEPAIEVTGMASGYVGLGFRNSIPSRTSVKINIRSAPNQNPNILFLALKKFLLKEIPPYVKIDIKSGGSSSGTTLEIDNEFAERARKIMRIVYKKEPTIKHSGGTLPIVNHFKEILKVPQVMIPLANEDCGMHSASENISLNSIKKGLSFSSKFFSL